MIVQKSNSIGNRARIEGLFFSVLSFSFLMRKLLLLREIEG